MRQDPKQARKEVVRAIVRGLTDKGLAQYGRGLSTEDGEVAGAGYAITGSGLSLLRVVEGAVDV